MLVRSLLDRFAKSAAVCVTLSLGATGTGCSSQREPDGPPIGQTRADGLLARDIEAPKAPAEAEPAVEETALTRQELNALAAEREEARQAEWARAALAEVASPNNDLGVVVVVAQRASDLPWLLAIQNRGEQPVSLVALPEMLTFEVVPKDRPTDPAPATPPAGARSTKTPPPPPPIWCGDVPKEVGAESHVTLLPSEILVYPFDPRSYCEESDVLEAGATIKARYGFPLETKKVWRKGKMEEEVLPPKAPLAFELAPQTDQSAPAAGSAAAGSAAAGSPAAGSVTSSAAPTSSAGGVATDPATPPPTLRLKHVEAAAFVLDSTYPLERIAPLGRIEPSGEADAPVADAASPAPTSPGTGEAVTTEAPPTRPPPPPPLTLSIRPLGATANPGGSTVTVTAKNTSGRSMRLFLRRELVSYQVTGPAGPTTCRMTPGARAPSPAAYSSLGPGASLSLTTRLAEACPKGTFNVPGSYTVFARIDAQNDGREHGFVAFTGTVITQQPAALTVRGTGAAQKPVMRVTSGR